MLVTAGEPFRGDLSELVVAQICDRFKCLPSQVRAEDAYAMARTWAITCELDRIHAMRSRQK